MNIRHGLLVPCLLSLFASAALAADAGQPSLSETLSWLREKVGAVKYHDARGYDWTFELAESKDPCTLVYRSVRTRLRRSRTSRIENVFTVKLVDLEDRVTSGSREARGVNLSNVHLNSKRDAVLEETTLTHSREPDQRQSFIIVKFLEQDMAERATKAFERAIVLCKAEKKPEPF